MGAISLRVLNLRWLVRYRVVHKKRNSITPSNLVFFWKKGLKSKVDTRYTSPVVWSSPYACARPYHPGKYEATIDSCFGFVRPHQHGIADTCRGGFFSNTFKRQLHITNVLFCFFNKHLINEKKSTLFTLAFIHSFIERVTCQQLIEDLKHA